MRHILEDEDVVEVVKLTADQQRKDANYAQRCQDSYDKYKARKKKKKEPLKL